MFRKERRPPMNGRWSNEELEHIAAAMRQGAGRISVAGRTHDVAFAPTSDDALQARIDDAYRRKYADSPYLSPMIGARARAATVRITPQEETR